MLDLLGTNQDLLIIKKADNKIYIHQQCLLKENLRQFYMQKKI
jgi:hypothetical protein